MPRERIRFHQKLFYPFVGRAKKWGDERKGREKTFFDVVAVAPEKRMYKIVVRVVTLTRISTVCISGIYTSTSKR